MLVWNLGDHVTSLSAVGGMPTSAFPQTKLNPQTTLKVHSHALSDQLTALKLRGHLKCCEQPSLSDAGMLSVEPLHAGTRIHD